MLEFECPEGSLAVSRSAGREDSRIADRTASTLVIRSATSRSEASSLVHAPPTIARRNWGLVLTA